MAQYVEALVFDSMPPLGPWLLYSHLDMNEAMMVLIRSMEQGWNGRVMYSMARQARACRIVL